MLKILATTAIFSFPFLLSQRGFAQSWVNGQAASYVIGQPGFNSNVIATTSTGLGGTFTVIVDPATGKVFVDDFSNSRVLRYPSTAAMANGAAAEAVLGEPDFTSNAGGSTATTLSVPEGLAIDASGNLWVADGNNNRVLRFANAATIANGAAASEVLGQSDFISSGNATTQTTMSGPTGLFCVGTTLWVGDTENNRVLRYDNAASKANGGPADAVFGQAGFTTATGGLGAAQLRGPQGVFVDASDNLWVCDFNSNRVLLFPGSSTAANGEAATLVLGQTAFGVAMGDVTASKFESPAGVYGDGMGNLYVADFGNSRVMVFANAASLADGAAASYVLGQAGFTSSGLGDGASQLDAPSGLYVDPSGTSLLVADNRNRRVLIYSPAGSLPLLLTGFTGRLQENGEVLLQWQVSDAGGAGSGGTVALEYSTGDTTGFTDVLTTQAVNPAVAGYSYLQVAPAKGVNYYRVKLTGLDGLVVYSQVATVLVSGGATGLRVYPNPASSEAVVTLPGAGAAVIEVYNDAGVLMRRVATSSGVSTLDVGGWAAGVYLVKVVQGTFSGSTRFVVMR